MSFNNRLFHLNIPAAVALVMDEAIKQEKLGHSISAMTWFNLAQDIERGEYLTSMKLAELVRRYPFLNRCRQ